MTTQAVNPSLCAQAYSKVAPGVDWIRDHVKTLSASAGETLGKMWAAVCAFFSSIAQTLGQWMRTAKEGLLAAKAQIVALPRETKILGGVALGVTAVISWIGATLWNKPAAAAAPETMAAATPAANAAAAPAAAGAAPGAAAGAAPAAAAAGAAPVGAQ